MGRKKSPGLVKRGGVWHIDKTIRGERIRESTGESSLREAETYLARRIDQRRQAVIYGVRPDRTFRAAATKYLDEVQKTTIRDDAVQFRLLDPYIGDLPLKAVHIGSLRKFVADRRGAGVKSRTINAALQTVRHLLNLAASEWLDEDGLTWLETAPKIRLLPQTDEREPYPLSWDEQRTLFRELPRHLANMALFAVNTGARNGEICSLRWDWEVPVPELGTSVFMVPGKNVKNREERLVVLNSVARSVIEDVRGEHDTHVFTYRGHPIKAMNNTGWQEARKRAGMPHVRVHDLKHTFGRRLRAAGVCFEDRQDLLGHKSGRITTHYSEAELQNLISAAEKICALQSRKIPTMVILKRRAAQGQAAKVLF